jgi:hypothetical protein
LDECKTKGKTLDNLSLLPLLLSASLLSLMCVAGFQGKVGSSFVPVELSRQGKTLKLIALRDEIDGPEVLIGAGVKASVIAAFLEQVPGSRAFHMSGKTAMESGMRFRREGVPMGLPGLDEWHIPVTDRNAVAAAKALLAE